MKHWWLIPIVAGIAFVLGRLSVEPKVVTETVIEYHALNTSAIAPIKVSEPIGTRAEKVRLVFAGHLRDTTKKVDHIEDKLGIVEGLSNDCLMGLSNSQSVTDSNAFVAAELPIRDYTFSDDSTYTITARGVYVESLPQIEFTPRTVTTTRTETVVRAPRITHGFQLGAGAALTPKGVQPALYLGYGFTIKF